MRLLLFRIKSHPGVTYESVAYKKECTVVLWPCKHEETTFPHEFVFVLTQYIIGTVFSKKNVVKGGGVGNTIKGDDYIRRSKLLNTMILF